ncbi:hypothetical protein BUALT_Bualt17G0034800 [Buddleja alternifolia]|uniref:Helitron helicase-like domain-containing protein n=1 Tax=Buddleja alternifolia TaxID=168488 RepID=A0AAV6W407_9LAMI|nr:hypothetical protein BUALT_Bualt17G0034800 [Buddleja alternifolia]
MLDSVNPYVQIFRSARDALQHDSGVNLHIRILHSRNNRQYNQPTASEIATLIVGDDTDAIGCRDIIVRKNDGYLKRISETHPSYTPLQYPLLFPYGTDGWRVAIEQQRLNYIKTHQAEMCGDLYQGLEDVVVLGDTDDSGVGKRVVLPLSFTGGPRNIMKHYQDVMAICRTIGPPDFFITFTCNPNWPKISRELQRLPGQRAEDRPDILARISRMKHKQLMKLLKEKKTLELQLTNAGEKHYLRMLLYKQACSARGLLDDDNEWHGGLSEAETWESSIKLRNMFSTMLMFSEITDPVTLWEQHWRMVDGVDEN